MGWFTAFREGMFPTLYGPLKTAVTADVLEAGFLYAIGILAFSFLLIVPGLKGKEGLYSAIRGYFAIFVTGSIMLVNFGQEWEYASLHTETAYKAGFRGEINANMRLKIGLRSINITLKGMPRIQVLHGSNETIDYNERFSWDNSGWTLGRAFFGPYAGRFNQEFREAQYKGTPYPILWVAEYFTIDGEGIRWGRYYFQAGYYTHIMVWLSFLLWLLTMILMKTVLNYAAYFCVMTGGCLITANILFASIRNPNELRIPIGHEVLETHWGWCFGLCLFTGIVLVIVGIVTWLINEYCQSYADIFFDSNDDNDYEEYYCAREDLINRGVIVAQPIQPPSHQRSPPRDANGISVHFETSESSSEDDIYENPEEIARWFRRRRGQKSIAHSGPGAVAKRVKTRIQKSIRSRQQVLSGPYDNAGVDGETYENVQLKKTRSPPPRPPRKEQL